MNNLFLKNFFRLFISNIFIIISGIITGFILPKILGVSDYGYYKIFNLYTTYVVFFNFGIPNGLYLIYGGKTKDDIPIEKFRLYFRLILCIQLFTFLIFCIISFTLPGEYKFIFYMLSIYLVFNNISTYFEIISTTLSEFKRLSIRNILKSILSIFIIIVLWVLIYFNVAENYYKIYTIMFVIVYFILAIMYCCTYRNMIFGSSVSFRSEWKEIFRIMKIGIPLFMADMIASLIFTIDRQFVSNLFSIEIYSLYSFAYSMLKIITLSISAIAVVLYPSLKKMKKEELASSYNFTCIIVAIVSFGCILGYFPLHYFVNFFLIDYSSSLRIFTILFPSVSISSIITMVMINHYKANNKQNTYLFISFIVLVIAFILNIISFYLFNDPIGFAYSSVLTIIIWFGISEYFICKMYNCSNYKLYIYILNILFSYYIIVNSIFSIWIQCLIYLVIFCLLDFIFFRIEIKNLFIRLGGKKWK